MRIDYSEPKKSYVTSPGLNRPRKESTGLFTTIIIVTGIITFSAGFGTGWFLSQKSAKKSFQAATEQNSLENTPKIVPAPAPAPPQPVQPATAQAQTDPATAQQPPSAPGVTRDPPLSFYKTLPNGQKGNALGSGINLKDDKSKHPLQAPMPSNLNRPTTPDPTPPPAEKAAGAEKIATKRSDHSTFTVQVASFPLRSEAETLKNKLAAKSYSAFIVESNQGDKGTWYRVRVGKRLEQETAKELAGKLGRTALVIPDSN